MAKFEKRDAYKFIFLLGLVSLFGDITYESARAITGPYLAVLGASALAVGFVSGLGEFAGYALRLASGHIADRTRAYWPITFIGYGLIFSIPMLGLAGNWQVASALIIFERLGKAIRSPARDAILSHATKKVGRGWGFGIHEFIDQIGAVAGPLLFAGVFALTGSYRKGFAILWIPAALAILFLFLGRLRVPEPERFEEQHSPKDDPPEKLSKEFILYIVFSFLSVAGFVNFQIISYHIKANTLMPDSHIPLLYALAMGVDAFMALFIGRVYDRIGLGVLFLVPIMSLPIPLLGLSESQFPIYMGIVLWGLAMGAHETVMRAAIADIVPRTRRAFAYGVFNTIYGVSWFVGSSIVGYLYGLSKGYINLFVFTTQALAMGVFFYMRAKPRPHL